ncbi:hypothetical protein [Mycobacteroides chelonae]|uniref:hypothetical protein n=1 Tax=Mycobacteroides chelonae TaxID=1774 RepID=UPI000991A855|nr:hypothetical protein [Mycobacteroides chelonae]
MTFNLCHECATAIVNDDYSSYDVDEERIRQFLESLDSYLCVETEESEQGNGGYWDCDACEQVQIGTGHNATECD